MNLADQFLDKVCTILTQPVSLHLKDHVACAEYFTGRVIAVDNSGIWLEHLQTRNKSFFFFPVVGIVEEQYLAPGDPRIEEIKLEIEKQKQKKQEQEAKKQEEAKQAMQRKVQKNSTFIPVEELMKKIKKS